MSVPFSNTKLRVPHGFQTLLEALTREVLRESPNNIYDFAATFCEALIENQNQGKLTGNGKQSSIDDRYYNNHAFKEEYQVNDPNANEAATSLQAAYRGHQSNVELHSHVQPVRSPRHQSPTKSSSLDQSLNESGNPDTSHHVDLQRKVKTNESREYDETLRKQEDEHDAALKIQAAYRGYITRKKYGGN